VLKHRHAERAQTREPQPVPRIVVRRLAGLPLDDYEPLVMLNGIKADGARQAVAWPPSGMADNFTKISFTIRDGVTWSDNQPMNAGRSYSFQLRRTTRDSTRRDPVRHHHPERQQGRPDLHQVAVRQPGEDLKPRSWCEAPLVDAEDPSTDTIKNPVGTGP